MKPTRGDPWPESSEREWRAAVLQELRAIRRAVEAQQSRALDVSPEDEHAVIAALAAIVQRATFDSLEVVRHGAADPVFGALLERADCHE